MRRQYKDISYTLTRSKRKTASIYVERDGQVSVLAPQSLTDEGVEKLLDSKLAWIYKNLAEWTDLNATQAEREFVNGESFLYLGRSYRLEKVKEQAVPLLLKNGYFHLSADAEPEESFKSFYREKGRTKIPERVALYAPKMGVTPREVRVQELQHRWASCSASGRLSFHWKCMMAPLTILDYIVVHEQAHLVHADHTEALWNQVDKVLPDHRERKQWLRVNGAGMGL